MVKCKICGRQFVRLDLRHLKVHGLTSYEEYESVIGSCIKKDLIVEVAQDILSGKSISETKEGDLDKVSRGVVEYAEKLVDIATLKRIARLGKLMTALDHTENLLLDPQRMLAYNFDELMQLASHLGTGAESLVKELKSGDRSVIPLLVQQFNSKEYSVNIPAGLPEDPRERASLLSKTERLLSGPKEI